LKKAIGAEATKKSNGTSYLSAQVAVVVVQLVVAVVK